MTHTQIAKMAKSVYYWPDTFCMQGCKGRARFYVGVHTSPTETLALVDNLTEKEMEAAYSAVLNLGEYLSGTGGVLRPKPWYKRLAEWLSE